MKKLFNLRDGDIFIDQFSFKNYEKIKELKDSSEKEVRELDFYKDTNAIVKLDKFKSDVINIRQYKNYYNLKYNKNNIFEIDTLELINLTDELISEMQSLFVDIYDLNYEDNYDLIFDKFDYFRDYKYFQIEHVDVIKYNEYVDDFVSDNKNITDKMYFDLLEEFEIKYRNECINVINYFINHSFNDILEIDEKDTVLIDNLNIEIIFVK